MNAPCGWFDATPVGRIINRFSQDMSTVVSSPVQPYAALGELVGLID